MKKLIYLLILLLLIPIKTWSQTDVKITELPEATTAASTDVVPVVKDAATPGSAVTSKMTFSNLIIYLLLAGSITKSGNDITVPGALITTAADGSRGAIFQANTVAYTECTAGVYGLYVDSTGWHWCDNGTERTPTFSNYEVTKATGTTSTTLTAAEVNHTIINNYGQGVTTNYIWTLPTAAKGMSFKVIIGTLVNSTYYFQISRGGTNAINAEVGAGLVTGKTYVRATQQNLGSKLECDTFQTGASTWTWFCKAISGTWTTD